MTVLYIIADEEETITVSQLVSRSSCTSMPGGTGSKDLQILPRVAALLHIIETSFLQMRRNQPLDIPSEVPVMTVQAAEQLLVGCTAQKHVFLDVSI